MKRNSSDRQKNIRCASVLYGSRCINCGSKENIQWHHVVPLHVGGNDIPENIVPLCTDCHAKVHACAENFIKASNGGRPPRLLCDTQELIVEEFIKCQIPKSFAWKFLKTRPQKKLNYVSEAMDRLGIIDYRNNIDIIIAKRGTCAFGDLCGWVKYTDGREELVYSPDDYNGNEFEEFVNDFLDDLQERENGKRTFSITHTGA